MDFFGQKMIEKRVVFDGATRRTSNRKALFGHNRHKMSLFWSRKTTVFKHVRL